MRVNGREADAADRMLIPNIILPCQIPRSHQMTGERRLQLAVLEDARRNRA